MKKVLSFVLAMVMVLSVCTFPAFADNASGLIIYPEHNEILPRNYDYEIEVSQGDKSYKIPVYDSARAPSSFTNTITNRHSRFSEFAFEGEVTVKVKVNLPVENYVLMPTINGIDSTFDNGVITFKLNKPQTVILRLNEDTLTQFAIFAEAPETDVPDENDENVIYVKAGLNNCDDIEIDQNAQFTIPAGKHLYLEPGALLTARLNVSGSNTTISGRGAILDPRTDRTGSGYMINNQAPDGEFWENIEIRDIKLLDAHGFNVANRGIKNSHIDGVKILSNQISSDGISFWGEGNENNLVENCYIENDDDNFVLNSLKSVHIRNCILSDTHAFVIPQGKVGTILVEDCVIIQSASFLKSWVPTSNPSNQWDSVTLRNIHAEDAVKLNYVISMRELNDGNKNVVLENIALPRDTVRTVWVWKVPSLNVQFNNVFIGEKEVVNETAFDTWTVEDPEGFKFGNSFDKAAAKVGTYSKMMKKVSYQGSPRVYVGGYETKTSGSAPFEKDGEIYLPAVETLNELDFNATYKNGTLTFKNGEGESKMYAGKTKMSYLGHNYQLSSPMLEENGCAMIPASFLTKTLGFEVKKSGQDFVVTPKNNGQNLIDEGDFENVTNRLFQDLIEQGNGLDNIYTRNWNAYNHGKVKLTNKDTHSGNHALRVAQSGAGNGETGVAQWLGDAIQKFGAGTYRLEFWARLGTNLYPDNPNIDYGIVIGGYAITGNEPQYALNRLQSAKLTDKWQKFTFDVQISDVKSYINSWFYVGCQSWAGSSTIMDFYLDDVNVTFVRPANKSNIASVIETYVSNDSGVFKGWWDANGKTYTAKTDFSSALLSPRFSYYGTSVNGVFTADKKDTNVSDSEIFYLNGYAAQGAQRRVGMGRTTLRFVINQSTEFISKLKNEGTKGVSAGVLVAKASDISQTLTLDTPKAKKVNIQNYLFNCESYDKYTVNIEGISPTEEVTVRPFVKYTDSSGVVRVIYGQAQTACIAGTFSSDVMRYPFGIANVQGYDNTVKF